MVKYLFPIKGLESEKDRIQSRLMIIAGLIIIIYALILTLSPTIRNHSENKNYLGGHWLGVVVWSAVFSILHRLSIKKLTQRDPYLLPVVALLSGIGLMTIWRLYPSLGLRQTIWLGLAALFVIAGILFPAFLDSLSRYKYLWLISGLVLTGLTIFLGSNPSGNGPTLWLNFLGIHFQPSELLKLLLIAFLAGYFTDHAASIIVPTRLRDSQHLSITLSRYVICCQWGENNFVAHTTIDLDIGTGWIPLP